MPSAAAEAALPGLVDRLAAHGLLERSVGEVAARLDCRPYSTDDDDLWVVSDLTPGLDGAPVRVGAEHVLGISSASTSLAQLTMRAPVGRALDLGTGCGVQALHLARHAERVVATDVNPRALHLARFNAALNEVDPVVEVRDGSFFAPVAGERFDLIVTNPPFVISPATRERLVYRDSGLPGDQVVEHLVRTAPDHLADDGWCQVLANWVIGADQPWDERLAAWLPDDCDALVVQREVLDPAAYVELWLKDEGRHGAPDYAERYDTWLSWFEDQRIDAVGFGWVNLHRTGATAQAPAHTLLEWPYDVEQPIAPAVAEWGRAAHAAVDLGSRLVARADLVQESLGPVGAADPSTIVLRQQRGLRRATQVDTVLAAAGRGLRRRAERGTDPRRGLAAARPRPAGHQRLAPSAGAGAGGRGLPDPPRRRLFLTTLGASGQEVHPSVGSEVGHPNGLLTHHPTEGGRPAPDGASEWPSGAPCGRCPGGRGPWSR